MWAEVEDKNNKQLIRRETQSSQDVCTLDSDHFSALFLPLASSFHPSCVSHPWWYSPHFPSLAGSPDHPGPASFVTVCSACAEFGSGPRFIAQVWNQGMWSFTPGAPTEPGKCQRSNVPGKPAAQRLCCLLLLPCSEQFKPVSSAPFQCKVKEATLNHRGPLSWV